MAKKALGDSKNAILLFWAYFGLGKTPAWLKWPVGARLIKIHNSFQKFFLWKLESWDFLGSKLFKKFEINIFKIQKLKFSKIKIFKNSIFYKSKFSKIQKLKIQIFFFSKIQFLIFWRLFFFGLLKKIGFLSPSKFWKLFAKCQTIKRHAVQCSTRVQSTRCPMFHARPIELV